MQVLSKLFFTSRSVVSQLGILLSVIAAATLSRAEMRAEFNQDTGRAELHEDDHHILTYNYHLVDPPEGLLEKIRPNNRKYAQPRSNYIHPLFGPDGEVLTHDWSIDHPHHRGIYWAWPEVEYNGERGDLHALQRVFARPSGKLQVKSHDNFAEIEAESLWKWDDDTAIVREVALIRAYKSSNNGRHIDLKFSFTRLGKSVTIARRDTTLYGGLNLRFSEVKNLEIVKHTDPKKHAPRHAWADATGIFGKGTRTVGIAMF